MFYFRVEIKENKGFSDTFSVLVIISYVNDYIWMLYFIGSSHSCHA
jgi:hypothetical protein